MAGTPVTINLGGWGGSGDDSAVEQLVKLLNELVDDLETFRAAMATANGAAVNIANLTARRVQLIEQVLQSIGTGTPDTTPASIAKTAGDAQSIAAATAITTPFTVTVTNAALAALAGVIVEWTTASDGVLSGSQSITDSSGVATMPYTTGTVVGTDTVVATVQGYPSLTASFTTTVVAGAANTIQAVSATDQSALTSAAVAAPPSVLITDAHGNVVAGTTVTFAVTAGGGSRTPATVDSGADGIATLTSWTLGASAGLNTLTATAAGLTGSPVTFNANGVAAAPTQIAVQSGGAQTGVTAGAAATATVFRAKDVSSNPVEGVTVTCTVASGNGTLGAATAVTDASGDASFTYTTHTTVETATITGAFTNASGVEVSASTTIASTAGTATKLVIATEPASNGQSGTVLPGQPIIHVTDANNNVVTGSTASIAAAIGTGNATISAGTPKAAVAGVATFTALTLTDSDGGANTVVFSTAGLTSATSTGVTLAPPVPVALQFVTQPGNVTEGISSLSCGVWILDENNVLVPGGNNAITVALTTPGGATLAGTLTVNASSGIASFTGLSVDTVGTYTLTATATGLTSAVSNSFTVSASSGTNEPAGYVRFAEWDCSALPTTTRSTTGMTDGAWQCERNGNQSIVGNKYQIRFPATLAAGTDPGNLRVSHDTGVNDPTDAFYMRIEGFRPGRSVADGGDAAYQNHRVDTKICHFKCFALGGGTGAAILRLLGQSPGNSLMQTFRVDVLSKQANIAYTQNVDATRRVTAGQDNTIEVQCVMNSSAGAADGIIKIWVNGTLVANHSNVVFKTASSGTVGFYDWWFEHTYGGTAGGAPPSGTRTRVDYWTYDSVYMSQP